MHRAYPGRPCLGGGRDWISPANPDAVSGDGHLHHETRPGLSTGSPYRAANDGQSRSGAATRETTRTRPGHVVPSAVTLLTTSGRTVCRKTSKGLKSGVLTRQPLPEPSLPSRPAEAIRRVHHLDVAEAG
jgi:hypothetical protein